MTNTNNTYNHSGSYGSGSHNHGGSHSSYGGNRASRHHSIAATTAVSTANTGVDIVNDNGVYIDADFDGSEYGLSSERNLVDHMEHTFRVVPTKAPDWMN
jgi:hypothetical protein